jgi:phenylalanyl-tRNA synthetase beta chain
MKISLQWLRNYIDLPLTPEETRDWLTSLGLEVEGTEQLRAGHNGLDGIVVGEVLTCQKHPDADRLSLCTVAIATDTPLQIVCGAPNVATGQKVLVATPGAEVLGRDGTPFTIKKGKIRGAVSEGMICAEDELGIGESHEGILVLRADAVPGTPAAKQLDIQEDWTYEIGLTPNRSDATHHFGVARDLYAALRVRQGFEGSLKAPDVSAFRSGPATDFRIIVEDERACPRYAGLILSGLHVGPSPDWLRQALANIGERSINNVVDVTNYVLHELGQPLHAFDLDKIAGRTIRVKTLAEGTPFTTLDAQERRLSAEDLMICDGNSRPLCMAGVFGGLDSGVTDTTSSLFLESAWFDPTYIRRSSMRHGLRTEAAKIFEKGADHEVVLYALQRAALLIQEVAGGTISSTIIDQYPRPFPAVKVPVRLQRVCSLTGVAFTRKQLHFIIQALGMPILEDTETHFLVQIPGAKSDVTREVDVIEEVLRVWGYDQVPDPGHIRYSVGFRQKPDPVHIGSQISLLLSARGYCECMNLSLDQSVRYEERMPDKASGLIRIHNTSNVHLDCMRADMLPNMLDTVLHNTNRQQADLRLFEFGKTYYQQNGQPVEGHRLLLLLCGRREGDSWLKSSRAQVDFYTLKADVQAVLAALRVEGWQEKATEEEGSLQPGLVWHRGHQPLVRMGLVNPDLSEAWGLDVPLWAADFDWDNLLECIPAKPRQTTSLLRFPTVRRDLALVVDQGVKYHDIEAIARQIEKKRLLSVDLFDVYVSVEHLGEGKKSCTVTFRFGDASKTMTDKEIDDIMSRLEASYADKLHAVIRR